MAAEAEITVTLLGTGNPQPSLQRLSQSTLVEISDHKLLIDCGRGAVTRLFQAGVRMSEVGPLFLTHLHSDHVVSIPDLWITGWHASGERLAPFRVFGPTGTRRMMDDLESAFRVDREIRIADEGLDPNGIAHDTQDVSEGVVYEADGISVQAIRVEHWPQADAPPSLGYRIEYEGRSVVFSGDTRYSEHLAQAAKGADLLVHEVLAVSPDVEARLPERGVRVAAHHTSPEEAAEVFSIAEPRLAVYSHIVAWGVRDEDLAARTRAAYSGELEVGQDLMRIRIGDEIRVERPE